MLQYTSAAPPATLLDTTVVDHPWHREYRLGLGVDAVTGQLRSSAVKPFTVEDQAPLTARFMYSLVQSESDMSSLISASTKGSYNLEGITVSAGTSFLNAVTVSELAVTLVAQVSVARSQYSLAPDYELTAAPEPGFREKYGDYFVAGYRAASSLFVVYQCRFTSSEQRSKFTATLSAKAPEVMTAEGSTEFERTAKETSASLSIQIYAQGVDGALPNAPASGWTPAAIVTTLLPWFGDHQAPDPFEAYLMAYRLIDPALPGEVPVAPDVFARLATLYDRFWLARGLFATCPDFGRPQVEAEYKRLAAAVQANQASMAGDDATIALLTGQTEEVLATLRAINHRQAFASQLRVAARTEPAEGTLIDADKGRVRWNYGYSQAPQPGIVITSQTDTVEDSWKIGWREHVFTFHDARKLIVGWDVICNWADGTGGDWRKDSDTIIGRSSGKIYVKSDYDRGYSWTVVWHVVDAADYPPID